jgi:hypothetical protein
MLSCQFVEALDVRVGLGQCSAMNAGRSIELGSTVIMVTPSVVLSQVF